MPLGPWGAVFSAFVVSRYRSPTCPRNKFIWQDAEISQNGIHTTYIRLFLVAPLCVRTWLAMRRADADQWIAMTISIFLLLYSACTAAIFIVFEPTIYGISGAIAEGNFVMIMLAAFTISCLRLWWAMCVSLGIIVIYAYTVWQWGHGDYMEFALTHLSNIGMAFCLGALTCSMFESLRRRQFLILSLLDKEKERYKNLLCTLVPPVIAQRIERGETPIADSHAEVAVLFSDFVGLTHLTSRVSPHSLVQLLNDMFSEFDAAAERHGIEKIKTIGDGYMAACGPPTAESMRSMTLVQFGLELVDITERVSKKHNVPISICVGVHCGSLIAGVIGKSRFAYDMWGETVNMASRMESSSLPGRVQVSEAAFQRLNGRFAVEARDNVPIKGAPDVSAYLVKALPA